MAPDVRHWLGIDLIPAPFENMGDDDDGVSAQRLTFECEVSTKTLCDGCDRFITRVQWRQCRRCQNFDLCHVCMHTELQLIVQHRAHCVAAPRPPTLMCDGCSHRCPTELLTHCDHCNTFDLCQNCMRANPTLFETHRQRCPNTPIDDMVLVNYVQDRKGGVLSQRRHQQLERIVADGIGNNRDALLLLKAAKTRRDDEGWRQKVAMRFLDYIQEVRINPVRILALDGGGVRALMILKILQSLDLDQSEFLARIDYFAGTSAGALVAFALCTGYTLGTLVETFQRPLLKKNSYTPLPMLSSEYDPVLIHDQIWLVILSAYRTIDASANEYDKDRILNEFTLAFLHQHWFAKRQGGLVVNAYDCTSGSVCIFNSRYTSHHHYRVFDVLTASMAAPIYFPMKRMQIDGDEHLLVDGGVYANNPELSGLWAAYLDATTLASYRILSFGTGLGQTKFASPNSSMNEGIPGWIVKRRIFDVMIESNMSFSATLTRQLTSFLNIQRFRFNCRFPESISLDDETFHETFARHESEITHSIEYQALRKFIAHFMKDPLQIRSSI